MTEHDDEGSQGGARGAGAGATEPASAGSQSERASVEGREQPSEPPRRDDGGGPPSGDGGDGEGGFPWGKACLGCGCAALLVMVCGGVGAVAFSGYLMQDFAETAQKQIEIRQEVREKRESFVESRDLEASFERPLTADQFESFTTTVESWRDSDPFQQIENLQDVESDSENASFVEQLRGLYLLWQAGTAVQKLGGAYLEAIEGHGGFEEHYGRMLRVGALVAAVHEVSSDRRFDNPGKPVSDAVAKLLYEKHDEVLEAYGDKIEKLRSEKPTFERLAERGNLGIYALAVLPRKSYETWHGFSVERREQIIEAFGWTISAEALTFGNFAFPIELGHELPVGSQSTH